jgi:hypothetical protein
MPIKSNLEKFITRAAIKHDNRYDYSKCVYINSQTCGCPYCAGNKLDLENFIKKAKLVHGNKYNYSRFIYIGNKIKGIIICKTHGEFLQKPNGHLNSNGCPSCINKNEQLVAEYLLENNIIFIRQYKIRINNKILKRGFLYCDFYIPALNLIIEYNGAQHYQACTFATDHKRITKEQAEKNFIIQQIKDDLKRNYCKENCINLLEIDGRIYTDQNLKEYLNNYFKKVA